MTKKLDKKFIGDDQVGSSQILIEKDQSLRGTTQSDAVVDLLNLNITDEVLLKGVKVLNSAGQIPADILPSYVDDVLEYADLAAFPATGETGKIYVALDSNKCYRWSGSTYILITSGAVDSVNGETGVVVLDAGDIEMVSLPGTSVETRLVDLESDKVAKDGDTMSGDLILKVGDGSIALEPNDGVGVAYDRIIVKADDADPAAYTEVSGTTLEVASADKRTTIGSSTVYLIDNSTDNVTDIIEGKIKLYNNDTDLPILPIDDEDVAVKKYVDDEIALVELLSTTPENQIVHVSKGGSDLEGTGSLAKPFLTIAAAQASALSRSPAPSLSAPYIIKVSPGIYDEENSYAPAANVFILGSGIFGGVSHTTIRRKDVPGTGFSPISIDIANNDPSKVFSFENLTIAGGLSWTRLNNELGPAANLSILLLRRVSMRTAGSSPSNINFNGYSPARDNLQISDDCALANINSSGANISMASGSTAGFISASEGTNTGASSFIDGNYKTVWSMNHAYVSGGSFIGNVRLNSFNSKWDGAFTADKVSGGTTQNLIFDAVSYPKVSFAALTLSNGASIVRTSYAEALIYAPAVSADWDVVPAQPSAALDELASRINAVEGSSGSVGDDVDNLVLLSGVPVDSTSLGAFTGSTIPDDQTIKQALQALETEVETKVSKAGDTMTGFLTLHADPTSPLHAASKQYVDAVAEGLHVHAPARLLASIDLGGTYNNGSAGVGAFLDLSASPIAGIDGVSSFSVGDRILLTKQNGNSLDLENGIYYIADAADIDGNGDIIKLTRALDFDTPTEMAGGDFVFVQEGSLYADTGWVMTEEVSSVGTTPVQFVQFSGAGTYTAGDGLELNGTQFSVKASDLVGNGLEDSSNNLQIKLDGASLAVSSSGIKSNIRWDKEEYAVTSTLTTGAFFDLGFVAEEDSISAWVDRLAIHEGASQDFTVSYTGGAGGVTRITFVNALVTPGQSQLSSGDTVFFKYQRKIA